MLQGSLKNNQALPGFLLQIDSMRRTVFGKSYFIASISLTLVGRWSIQFFSIFEGFCFADFLIDFPAALSVHLHSQGLSRSVLVHSENGGREQGKGTASNVEMS